MLLLINTRYLVILIARVRVHRDHDPGPGLWTLYISRQDDSET